MAAVESRREGRVLELTIDRPPANAIDSQTSRELGEHFAAFAADDGLGVAIVTGAGERFFCRLGPQGRGGRRLRRISGRVDSPA